MEHYSLIRILLIMISLAFIVDRWAKFIRKERDQSIFKLLLTLLVWSFVLVISILPTIAYEISEKIGLGKNLDSLIFMGFIIVFMLIYKLLSIIEKIEKSITDIIRTQAIENYRNSTSKKR